MSFRINAAIVIAAAAGVAGCATTPQSAGDAKPGARAGAEALALDRAAAREAIERAEPIERLAFWTKERNDAPDDVAALRGVVMALRDLDQNARAAQAASEGLDLHPEDLVLLREGGLALVEMGRGGEAVLLLRELTRLSPEDSAAFIALGLALDQAERHLEAQSAYQAALALAPDDAAALVNLGASLLVSGQPDKARAPLERAASGRRAPAQARQNLAVAYALLGRFEEAEELARADLPPQMAQSNLAYLRALRGDLRRWSDLGAETGEVRRN